MQDHVVVTEIERPDPTVVAGLAAAGVATVHEAARRTGLVGPQIRPIQQGVAIAGPAVTVSSQPGDNLMIHAAVEQCRAGDLLVVTTTSPSLDGLFGELFATALQRRGVRGLVTTTGVRDVGDLRAMGFPAWSAAVSAQGSVKATAGAVNVPIVIGGQLVRPGDAVLADDDGVVMVPRTLVGEVVAAAQAREDKEAAARRAFRDGELGLDRYGLRATLADLGVEYITAAEYAEREL
jgi:4-hydroxy-4-methyl-2-oxoglutarate aldolase